MLDVHVPHPTHTWKDFFIHIATIVVGLLIAIALEQTVEYLHHRQQVTETRNALRIEQKKDINLFALESEMLRQQASVYRTDLAVLMYLRSHPRAAPSSWPGKLDWRYHGGFYPEAEWETAQLDGVVEHMPSAEVQNFDDIYRRLTKLYADQADEYHAVEQARKIMFLYPDPANATPAALDEAIRAMSDVLMLHSRVAHDQTLIARRHANFGTAASANEIDTLLGIAGSPIQGDETPGIDHRVNQIESIHE